MSSRSKTLKSPETPILIVEDNLHYSQILRKMLEVRLGFSDITSVDNIEQAYEMISSEPGRFRMLFVDYNFPGQETGGSLLDRLNQETLLEDKVAFLITSEPTMENLKEALSAGARGVVAKPFDTKDIERQIEKAERALLAEDVESF